MLGNCTFNCQKLHFTIAKNTDTERDLLISLVERYRDQDSWQPDLIITEDGFNHLMDIMELAGELDQRADFDKIVTNKFAEKAMK